MLLHTSHCSFVHTAWFDCGAQAYYRRAEANILQQHYKKAIDDFKVAAKLAPKDPLIRQRKELAEKLYRTQRFEEALHTEVCPVVHCLGINMRRKSWKMALRAGNVLLWQQFKTGNLSG